MGKKRLPKSKQQALRREMTRAGGQGRALRRVAGAPRSERSVRVRDGTLTDRYHAAKAQEDGELFEQLSEKIHRRARGRKDAELRRAVAEEAQQLAAGQPRPKAWRRAIVTQGVSQGCIVSDEGRPVECLLRGSLKEIVTDAANPVAVGDWVWYAPQPDGTGMVEEVEPRRTKLSRPAARHRHLETVLVANVDQVVVVSSVREPEFRQGLVDRCLLAAERGGMEGVVCVNKSDLADEQAPLPRLDFYERVGYRVLVTSARTGEGVDALRAALAGRTSVLAGHSGTGKSSLLNAIQPGLKLKVGDISQSTQKGRHTTTSVTLLRLDVGGFVVDTPGIRAFGLWDLHKEDLAALFPEIAQRMDDCQMRNCTHVHEPGCAVKQAVEAGDMAPERYDSYVSIRESLPFGAPWKHED